MNSTMGSTRHIRPLQYDYYQVSDVSSDVESVRFNWASGIAVSTGEDQSWTIQLDSQVLDQIGY